MTNDYKLKHYLGDVIHEGTLVECNIIIEAMKKVGVLDRKLEIEYPEHHGFELSPKLKDQMVNLIAESRVNGKRDSSYGDLIQDEESTLGSLDDVEILEEFEMFEYDEKLVEKASAEYRSFLVEKILLEEK